MYPNPSAGAEKKIEALQDHITSLNTKNSITQYCVIALTVVSIAGSAIQIWYAAKADERETAKASTAAAQPQSIQLPASAPTPETPQATHPAASKAAGEKTSKAKPGS